MRKISDLKMIKQLLPFFKNSWWLVLLSVIFLVISQVLTVLLPLLTRRGVDEYILKKDLPGLSTLVLIMGIVLLTNFFFQVFSNYTVEVLGQRLLMKIRMSLYKKVLNLSNEYFDTISTGSTITNITNDVEALRQFISEGLITILGQLLLLVLIVCAMLYINMKLALFTLLSVPVFVMVTALFRRSIRNGFRGVRKANSEINRHLVESINGIREIKLFNHNFAAQEEFDIYNSNYLRSYLKVVFSYALFFPVMDWAIFFSMLMILIYASINMGSGVSVGQITAFSLYIRQFFRPLKQLAENFNVFQSAMAAMERIIKLLNRESKIQEPISPKKINRLTRGEIRFNNVHFSYNDDQEILKGLSFIIRPGEKIAIVGSTGAGKTTVINLLSRFYDVDKGSIEMDGIDIRDLSLRRLRQSIAIVPQEVFLFSGSVAENITMFDKTVPEEETRHAAREVNANLFIERLPGGYQQDVKEEGRTLSAGEKQLLSIARVFIRRPTVIVLDEATSNIDAESEKRIEIAVQNLMQGKTAILIAHRLSTIKSVDRILVLHRGQLVEEGTHNQLLERNGIYTKLFKMQSYALQ